MIRAARWVAPGAALALILAASVVPAARAERPAADPVLLWNDQTNRAIQATNTDALPTDLSGIAFIEFASGNWLLA